MTARPLTATYRLQFSKDFTFADARRLVPYLRDLGVSHLYASPIFHARPGSSHGYDVIDHDAINPELGGEEGFRALVEDLHAAGLGVIVDIVPNHAGIGGTGNTRWQDVLEFGRRSRNARFFDIDWSSGPLVLPILDAPLQDVVAAGRLHLDAEPETGRFALVFEGHHIPVRPKTVGRILTAAGRRLSRRDLVEAGEEWTELEGVRAAASGRKARRERIAELLADPAILEAVKTVIADEDVAAVAGEQHYRMMFWREGAAAINYRRFFDISDLAGLRVEEPAVFDAVHRLPVALVNEGRLDGLRVDHVDGLADPGVYCAQLRDRVGPDISIHVEKILGEHEPLRNWPVDGTTGYETLNILNGVFVEPAGYDQFAAHLAEIGVAGDNRERIESAKREILERSFSAELDVLARLGADLSRRVGHPVRLRTMREIIVALIAALPVYRTYIGRDVSPEDREILFNAATRARQSLSRGAKRALVTLVEILGAGATDDEAADFIRRFQQLSGPAMAKGYEDTELYRYVALASVNEVGSHLTRPYLGIDEFHSSFAEVARRGLKSLTPLSTHDTKRGSDTRARLNVLSEMSEAWLEACERWHRRHTDLRERRNDVDAAPDRVDEDLIYQTILGAWPIDAGRLTTYLVKAMREAKRHTSWTETNETYEAGVIAFATALVSGRESEPFRREIEEILGTVGPAGRRNSLSQTVLQLTVPGIPDIYRGSEFYEYVLVDPDNRRPVDWTRRIEALGSRGDGAAPEDDTSGVAKQWTIARVLALRREDPDLFRNGSYDPLPVTGAQDVLAFARRLNGSHAIVIAATRALAPRFGDVVVDLGANESLRWRTVVGARDVRQEGRLLRVDRTALPTVVVGTPRG